MPVNRSAILDILAMQDTFADKAEDIAIILTFRKLSNYSFFNIILSNRLKIETIRNLFG